MSRPPPQLGSQQSPLIEPGQAKNIFDHRNESEGGDLTRVTCDGEGLIFTLTWGTSVTRELKNIIAPFSCDLPGSCGVVAMNGSGLATIPLISAVLVSAKGPCVVREVIDATGGPVLVQKGAARIINPGIGAVVYDWEPGTTTIANDPNTIGRPFPISSDAIITAGIAIVEYEI